MRKTFTPATAFAASAFVACLLWGSAQATSAPVLKSEATPGMVVLVGHGGGGGGWGGGGGHAAFSGGGGGHGGGWGGGGSRSALSARGGGWSRGQGGGNFSARSFSHHNFSSRSFDTGRSARSFPIAISQAGASTRDGWGARDTRSVVARTIPLGTPTADTSLCVTGTISLVMATAGT
jgi:hypothetical protein